MFNFCENKVQTVLYVTTLSMVIMGLFYVWLGCIIIWEFLPLLPGFFDKLWWGQIYLYIIATGVFAVVTGVVGCSGIDKYEGSTICKHRIYVLFLSGIHAWAMYIFIRDFNYNKDRIQGYLSRSIAQIRDSDGVSAAKTNENIWFYFELELNCQRKLGDCKPSDATDYVMWQYHIFIGFMGFCGAVFVVDLLLTFFL